MKVELCVFSAFKIYPGHGKRQVKYDGKVLHFINRKCHLSHKRRKNPRKTTWTVLYRRKWKKGLEKGFESKKKTRKTHKFQKAIIGASLTEIMAMRNMKPEVRKAQRDQAIRVAKEKARAVKAAKQATKEKSVPAQAASKGKAAKVGAKAAPKSAAPKAPRVGGKR